jgi:hypothetical protein
MTFDPESLRGKSATYVINGQKSETQSKPLGAITNGSYEWRITRQLFKSHGRHADAA